MWRPLSSLFRRLAGKSMTYAEWFARAKDAGESASDSGVDTSQPFAQSAWVYAAVGLIARTLASVPFVLADEDGRELKGRKSGNDLRGLIERPNRRQQNWQQFVVASMMRPLLDGHLFWHRVGMRGNRPGEVMVRPARKLQPDVRQDEFGDDFAPRWFVQATGEPLIVDDELFEWKLENPYDDVHGLAPLSPGALALYCDVATGIYNRQFFENGARPGIVFTSDHPGFDQAQADAAKAMWDSKHKGYRAHFFQKNEVRGVSEEIGGQGARPPSDSRIVLSSTTGRPASPRRPRFRGKART